MDQSLKFFIKRVIVIAIAAFITLAALSQIDVIFALIGQFFVILTPFFIGFAIAYILNQPIKFIKKHFKLKESLAIFSVYLCVIIIVALFSVYLLPTVVNNSISLGNEVSKGVFQLVNNFEKFDFGPFRDIAMNNLNRIAELLTNFSNFIIVNLSSILIGFTAALLNLFFGIIISIYMLTSKTKIGHLFKRLLFILLGDKRANEVMLHVFEANVVFSHFLTGLIIEALVVGMIAFLGFSVIGIRYGVVLAMILCFTNMIPYIGPFIGAIPAVTATLLYDPYKALMVAIFIIILQQVDGNLIGPKIMGNYIGLDPIWIILSITIGGGYFGVIGVLLAIPTGAMLKIIISRLISRYNDQHDNI